ncbi:MAG: YjbH domain-containing protein [Chlamydiales bacterium]
MTSLLPISLVGASPLFNDLERVEEINRKIADELPFFYNYSFVGGYFTMPSARMAKAGTIALGGASASPYYNFGLNFQVFDHVELAGNYRIFRGITEQNFGHEGFGDDAERIGNFKLALLLPEDGFSILPSIAIGCEDFVGTKRFNAKYVVVTQRWLDANLEFTLGYGQGRINGIFGGAAWSPFRAFRSKFLRTLSLIGEYDAINYKKHPHEHPRGRKVKTRVNAGLSYTLGDTLQLSVSSLRGREIAASASLRYPLGDSKGLFAKVQDPLIYSSPIDTEPLGVLRGEKELARELAYAFSDQGLDLYTVYLAYTPDHKKSLYLKIINNRYREERVVRDRLEHLLSALAPSDIAQIVVVIEAVGTTSHAYTFRREDLMRYQERHMGRFELEALAPMREAPSTPSDYDATLLFHRKKRIWEFTVNPRLLTFFGSAKGKFKYNLAMTASPEGYLFDQVYYRMLFSYNIKSSFANLGQQDRLNPSKLLNVRTDSLRYYQSNTVAMEEAYLQRGWNLGRGWFYRLSGGYFEPAYGGGATELLYFPLHSPFAMGVEAAVVEKRRYKGVAFTDKIRKLDKEGHAKLVHFLGVQYFFNFYYEYKPLNIELKVKVGRFLAKDVGVRAELARYFRSGLRFGIWYTHTNARDVVNGKVYHDKGFSFTVPFDMFLKQSSRNYIGYATSVWLRDQGAVAGTGRTLFYTLLEERYNYDKK